MKEYKEELQKIEIKNLREIVFKVFEKIKTDKIEKSGIRIRNKIDELRVGKDELGETQILCLSGSVLKLIVEDNLWNDKKDKKTGELLRGYSHSCKKETLIDFLGFFYKTYGIKWDFNIDSFQVTVDGENYYDMFYWRKNGQGDDTVGIGRMKILNNWENVKLRLFFQTKTAPFADLEGSALMLNGNLYINLFDKTILNSRNDIKANGSIILYNLDKNKDKIIFGCMLTSNRLRQVPLASILILKKSNKEEGVNTSKYMESIFANDDRRKPEKIDDRIFYYLSGRQIRVEEKGSTEIVEDLSRLPGYEDYKKIENLEGTYQSFNFSTNSGTVNLRSFIIEISKSGIALIRKNTNQTIGEGDAGRARILKNDIQDKLLLQFDYNDKSRCYGYSLLLQINKVKDLHGIFFGLIDSQIASGRIYLKRTTIDSKPLDIIEIGSENPLNILSKIPGSDSEVVTFFLNENFDSYTDVKLNKIIQSKMNLETFSEENSLPEICLGYYKCYFPTKRVSDDGLNNDASTYGLVLNVIPILITKDEIRIKIGAENIKGTFFYDNASKIMLNFKSNLNFVNLIFFLSDMQKINHIYATFNQIGNIHKVESSACILIKQDFENSFSEFYKQDVKHQTLIKFQDLIEIEKETKGALTKIIGSWNRTILLTEKNNISFTPRQKAYRRTFWYSALYLINEFFKEEDIEKRDINILMEAFTSIKRAYNHGFGMKFFSIYIYEENKKKFDYGVNIGKNLKEQIQFLEKEIDMVENLLYSFKKEKWIKENDNSEENLLLIEIENYIQKYFVNQGKF